LIPKTTVAIGLVLTSLGDLQARAADPVQRVELCPRLVNLEGLVGVEYLAGDELVGRADRSAPAGIALRLPGESPKPVNFRNKSERNGFMELTGAHHGSLTLRLKIERVNPSLVKRTLEVTSEQPQRFAVSFAFFPVIEGDYSSFSGIEVKRVLYDTLGGGPEYPGQNGQTFPVAAIHQAGRVLGIVADSPAQWENRCLVVIDPPAKQLSVLNGDGRDPYDLTIKYDKPGTYQYKMDGWQSLAAGQSHRYVTWLFAEKAQSHYDVQLAAHLALANAKGWNGSALEAILRNTSYLLLRRNLMRPEGAYIFISGIGYGWKQWVSDGFYQAIALDDPDKLIAAYHSIFSDRVFYEDNAQYYLIWSVLVKRAGGKLNDDLVRQAYDFLRSHERDGIYYPPAAAFAVDNVSADGSQYKTYMDMLRYQDDDAPASNQGFHCGALLAARELGLPVRKEDVERAIAGYRRMYNDQQQYMPTSLKRQDHIGQDTLYGEALTYAVFGRKLLTDEQVVGHMRTSQKIKTPFGLRVISEADGSLLPGHAGHYMYGGSWFLCDAANYLVARVHGLPSENVDRYLIERLEKELAFAPAFNESINTVTGKPHGHILYSWNSGYWWLRREFRKRLGQTGPDAVEAAIDRKLGVLRDKWGLRLEPNQATLRPAEVSQN